MDCCDQDDQSTYCYFEKRKKRRGQKPSETPLPARAQRLFIFSGNWTLNVLSHFFSLTFLLVPRGRVLKESTDTTIASMMCSRACIWNVVSLKSGEASKT